MKTRASHAGILACGCLLLAAAAPGAPPLTPDYLSGMPTPARIEAELRGKDAEDTIERQMGAFQALIKMIDDMAWGLEKRYLPNRGTADEARLKDAYQRAYAELWHKATNNEAHTYDHDRQLRDELLARFVSDNFRAAYFNSDAKAAANAKAQFQKNYGIPGPSPAAPGSPASAAAPAGGDFDSLCAAKGLDGFTCMVQGMMNGVIKVNEAIQGPPTPGLRMSGWYQSGTFKMILQGSNAWLNCDGTFLLSAYDVVQQDGRLLVRVENGASPFALALAADGTTLVGPPTVVIHGRAPGGGSSTAATAGSSHEVTTTTQRTLTPLEAQQYPDAVQNGQTFTIQESTTSTEYGPGRPFSAGVDHPKDASCRLGSIAAAPARPAEPRKQPQLLPAYLVPNGLRMAGNYDGQAGASLEFLPDQAIVACHATLEEHPYTVTPQAGHLLIHLGGAVPIDFALGADGTIRGEASVRRVNGHRKTGEDTLGDPTYAPSADACGYGALAPRSANAARR